MENINFKCSAVVNLRWRSDKSLCKAVVVKSDMDFTPHQILGILENKLREDDTGVVRDVT
jgi:hypothetical protein